MDDIVAANIFPVPMSVMRAAIAATTARIGLYNMVVKSS